MANGSAVFRSSIWEDRDSWRKLVLAAQWLYFLICTQEDLSLCGVLPLRPARWAALATDASPALIRKLVTALEAARFVLVDNDTEELMVRTYARHSGVLRNPKVTVGMTRQWEHIESLTLRERFFDQLGRDEVERIDQLIRAPIGKGIPPPFRERIHESNRESNRESDAESNRESDAESNREPNLIVLESYSLNSAYSYPQPLGVVPQPGGQGDIPPRNSDLTWDDAVRAARQ